jgi:hypothetical protein
MSNTHPDGSPDHEWDENGELAWNEFDWERYLREQDEAIGRYLRHYEACRHRPERIDEVADRMGWSAAEWNEADETEAREAGDPPDFAEDDEVYTLHKNPIFIATKAIYLGLHHSWERCAADPAKAPQPLAVALLASLHRGEAQAMQAVYALDFGDYAMAVSIFKRALSALNATLALVNDAAVARHPAVLAWRDDALPRLFDLREIWLRVMAECRDELDRPSDE